MKDRRNFMEEHQKKLGINGKKDIEAMGIDKFVEECKKNTALNIMHSMQDLI